MGPTAIALFAIAITAANPVLSRTDVVQHLRARGRGWSPQQVANLANLVHDLSDDHDLDPELVLAVMAVESGFRFDARSPVGALGLMQVMPSTGRVYAHPAGVRWRGARTLYDPVANVRIGTLYLAWLIRKFDGDLALALTSYCHGIGRVRRSLRSKGKLSYRQLRYSRRVLRQWARLRRARRRRNTLYTRPYQKTLAPQWKRYAGTPGRSTRLRYRAHRRRP